MKLLPDEEHPAPLQFGKIMHADTSLCPNWRGEALPLISSTHGLHFLPYPGTDYTMPPWVSEGHSVIEQRGENLKPDKLRDFCLFVLLWGFYLFLFSVPQNPGL